MKKVVAAVALVILAVVAIAFYWFFFRAPATTVSVANELDAFSIGQSHIDLISASGCSRLAKNDSILTVNGCNGDFYFKVFLGNDSYTFGKCTEWATPREAFLKLSGILDVKECRNATSEDSLVADVTSLDLKVYDVCGLKISFRDECITGVVG